MTANSRCIPLFSLSNKHNNKNITIFPLFKTVVFLCLLNEIKKEENIGVTCITYVIILKEFPFFRVLIT